MSQIFHPSFNTIAKVTIFGGILLLGLVGQGALMLYRSSYITQVAVAREQPVPFSHEHHVGGLGIDCRFCHTAVEDSSFAGMPSTEVCMKCHSILWSQSPMLEPVRESYRTGKPLEWSRVYDLPDFVYFNHSIHVQKGVACVTCHGQIDKMPLTWRNQPLHMEWCLNCHRHPEKFVRPKEFVFSTEWSPPKNQTEMGNNLVEAYHIKNMTDCTVCHR